MSQNRPKTQSIGRELTDRLPQPIEHLSQRI